MPFSPLLALVLATIARTGAVDASPRTIEASPRPPAQVNTGKRTVGAAERAVLLGANRVNAEVEAELEPGKPRSVLHVSGVEAFERGAEKWARFKVGGGRRGRTAALAELASATLEARVVGEQVVGKRGKALPVVNLEICLAGQRKRIDVALVGRGKGKLALGADVLEGWLAVDAAKKFTSEPGCNP